MPELSASVAILRGRNMESNTEPRKRSKEGLALALSIWFIVAVSVAYFFQWGVPELASDRGELDTLYYVILAVTGVVYVAVQVLFGSTTALHQSAWGKGQLLA